MADRELGAEPEPAGFRPAAGIIPILILGCIGCVLFGIRDCHRSSPPAPVPSLAPTNTLAPVVSATPTPEAVAPSSREAAALRGATEAFGRYRQLVFNADFIAASNAFRSIDTRLPSADLQTNFWAQTLPDAHRASLTLASLCLVCPEGKCWRCRGEGSCTTCSGSGTCQTCKGQSARMARCKACLCATCGGTARCRACRGQALVLCSGCGGSGSSSITERTPCAACQGSGTRSGLQRGDRYATPLKCLTCRGTGKREVSRFGPCTACNGRGRIACSACRGSGRCATCTGRGHRIPCAVCKDTGQVRLECRQCNGSGRCADCAGSGRCNTCNGAKLCPKCVGTGLIRQMSLVVDQAWLSQARGYIVSDAKTGEKLATGSGDGEQLITIRDRSLTISNAPTELIWISTDGSFGGAKSLMMPWVERSDL
ncbi:MAG: hypothetical protein K8T26_15790 [Lentisphaerae bacterium]|nr:hypothetical protein [Lentisphaerota bacterium]